MVLDSHLGMTGLPQHIKDAYIRLSLLSEADAGVDAGPEAVGRAYQAALQQIDPASQAEALANLQAAHETALAWARDRQQARQEPDGAAAAAPPATTTITQADVDTALQEWLPRLVDRGESHPGALLAQALRDERLASADAQRTLQSRIAAVLAQDPGQRAALFDAAVFRFQWDVDNGSELTDRWIAAWIAQACGESLAWRSQADARGGLWGGGPPPPRRRPPAPAGRAGRGASLSQARQDPADPAFLRHGSLDEPLRLLVQPAPAR
jgi:hypothetical protein